MDPRIKKIKTLNTLDNIRLFPNLFRALDLVPAPVPIPVPLLIPVPNDAVTDSYGGGPNRKSGSIRG
jgi:hypothetical protein